jgi:hypothetical protein
VAAVGFAATTATVDRLASIKAARDPDETDHDRPPVALNARDPVASKAASRVETQVSAPALVEEVSVTINWEWRRRGWLIRIEKAR